MAVVEASDIGLVAIRAAVGVVFVAHGYNHIFGGGKIAGTSRWFDSLGMRPSRAHAWLASLTEIGAGAMTALGILTPLASAGIIGTMIVALVINHRKNGFFIFRPGEGYEYVMTLSLIGLGLAGIGAGRLSLDHALGWFDPPGWPGLLVAACGAVGAGALLAACWRPRSTGHETVA